MKVRERKLRSIVNKWCKLAKGFKAERRKINGRKTRARCIASMVNEINRSMRP